MAEMGEICLETYESWTETGGIRNGLAVTDRIFRGGGGGRKEGTASETEESAGTTTKLSEAVSPSSSSSSTCPCVRVDDAKSRAISGCILPPDACAPPGVSSTGGKLSDPGIRGWAVEGMVGGVLN